MTRIIALLIATSVVSLVLFTGCADESWTAYERMPSKHAYVNGELVDLNGQSTDQVKAKSQGCIGCHEGVGDPHQKQSDKLGCVDCHGGDATATTKEAAHPMPRHPELWTRDGKASAANPERSNTLLNDESPEWIRFVNPGDLRIANETCGGCHPAEVLKVSKSLMTTSAHFWGTAAYANGIVPGKRSFMGESYSREGVAQRVNNVPVMSQADMDAESVSPFIVPLPRFEATQPGNIYRVFERGSKLENPIIGLPDKEEEAGLPNNRLSDRGLGTELRIDFPVLNIHKTRLNDPHLSFLGSNEHPGDFRSSGCTACHVVYANDRSPVHSGKYAVHGNRGMTSKDNPDPTIPKDEPGHPIAHAFTKGVPSSQCMTCHMHQPNSFVNSYYGFTMWAYEADGDTKGPDGKALWPEQQKYPSHDELIAAFDRNPEEAAAKGNWIDPEMLAEVVKLNANAKHTQFADYHGHGWIFRAAFKMDRKGNLLDKDGKILDYDDPDKFKGVIPLAGMGGSVAPQPGRAVHLKDIHAERGMHCADCHFVNDVHGNGKVYHEYQAAIEVTCKDCHGTVRNFPDLEEMPSGPAKASNPVPLGEMRTPWDKPRFEYLDGKLIQRSMVEEAKEWTVPTVKHSVDPTRKDRYNEKAAWAKTVRRDGKEWGPVDASCELAHEEKSMECYSCHTSWITSCFGCHLPQRGNVKSPVRHFEGESLRNFATYNPQVVRDSEFMLGVAGDAKGNKIAPVRSSSAVMISSEDANRRLIYIQQPTVSAPGYSSQAFNTHFPHTVRTTETRSCDDCHISQAEDNNAWLAQTYLLGTGAVGFLGHFAYVGTGHDGFEAVQVTEWYEPQAVIGSNLHRIAFPDDYEKHLKREKELKVHHHHGGVEINSLQMRGEYVYTASGEGGFRVYDVANVANKDFSEPLVSAPVSPLGQDTHVPSTYATAVALGFNNPVSMNRVWRPENKEVRPPEAQGSDVGYLHPLYRYAYVTDRYEGLILVDVECLTDGDPQNNFLERAVTFNPGGILNGAETLFVAGETVWVGCEAGIVAVNITNPLAPRIAGTLGAPDIVKPTAIDVQFRYAFVTDAEGLKVIDITDPSDLKGTNASPLPMVRLDDARGVYVAKTYAYVAGGKAGLVIVDVEKPGAPKVYMTWNDGGKIDDLNDVKIATTNDSMFAYLGDGHHGLKVAQIVSPGDGQPRSAFGWSPTPFPTLVSQRHTHGPAMAISRALDRDRAVDEDGNQVAVFGRIGGRPMNLEERQRLYMKDGKVYRVSNTPTTEAVAPAAAGDRPKRPEVTAPTESGGGD